MKKNVIFRILDANLNRVREGLRVCEDIVRFSLKDKNLTWAFKVIRHNLVKLSEAHGLIKQDLLKCRNSRFDVGRELSIKKKSPLGIIELFFANIQRSEEALRVLEEIAQIIDHKLESKFRKLRFKVYSLEARVAKKLPAYEKTRH